MKVLPLTGHIASHTLGVALSQKVLHFLDVARQIFCPLINHNHYLNLSFIWSFI